MGKLKYGPTWIIALAIALDLALVGLKLAGVVDCPWWLATAPLWLGLGLVIVIGLALAVATVVIAIVDNKPERR